MHTPQKSNPGCHSCMWIQVTLSLSKLTDSSFIDTQRFIQSLSDIPNVFVSPLISTLVSFVTIPLSNDLNHGLDNARDLLVVCHLQAATRNTCTISSTHIYAVKHHRRSVLLSCTALGITLPTAISYNMTFTRAVATGPVFLTFLVSYVMEID